MKILQKIDGGFHNLLQEDLEKRRREFQDSPLWTGLHGFLPYLLPLLHPFLLLILPLTVGQCLINKVTQLIQQRLEVIRLHQVKVHYQRLSS